MKVLVHHKNKCSGRYLKKSPYFGKPAKKIILNYTSEISKDHLNSTDVNQTHICQHPVHFIMLLNQTGNAHTQTAPLATHNEKSLLYLRLQWEKLRNCAIPAEAFLH